MFKCVKNIEIKFTFSSMYGDVTSVTQADCVKNCLSDALKQIAKSYHLTVSDVEDLFQMQEFKVSAINGYKLNELDLENIICLANGMGW